MRRYHRLAYIGKLIYLLDELRYLSWMLLPHTDAVWTPSYRDIYEQLMVGLTTLSLVFLLVLITQRFRLYGFLSSAIGLTSHKQIWDHERE